MWETGARVLRGEADTMHLGSGIFTAAIQLTEERSGASRGGSGGESVASASFLEFFFVFDLDFDFCGLSSQHFLTCKSLFRIFFCAVQFPLFLIVDTLVGSVMIT